MEESLYKKNKDRLIEYFNNGCKGNKILRLGIEVEHFVVDKITMRSINYYEKHGIKDILMRLSAYFPDGIVYSEGQIIGLTGPEYNITIEPAAQIEISIIPCDGIDEINRIYDSFIHLLTPILDEYNQELVNLGYHPVSSIEDMPLIPKKRYEYMNEYFTHSGSLGRNMMKGTASSQVSIDYFSEDDFVNKYRMAYFLGPIIRLLCDNTPVFEGRRCNGNIQRTNIWENVDSKRCGIINGVFKDDFSFESYADFIMNMPLILNEEDGKIYKTGNDTPATIWRDRDFTEKNVEHILSMSFLDIRLKKYLEIRFADSMPKAYMLAYSSFIKGLFSDSQLLPDILGKYQVDERSINMANDGIKSKGFGAEIYNKRANDVIKYLLDASLSTLDSGEKGYLDPLYNIAAEQKTLSDRWCLR